MDWEVQYARSAEKELEKLPSKTVQRIRKAIDGLVDDPRPPNCKKL